MKYIVRVLGLSSLVLTQWLNLRKRRAPFLTANDIDICLQTESIQDTTYLSYTD